MFTFCSLIPYTVDYIVSKANTEDLMLLYSLPAFAKDDPTAFLSGVARANQLVKKVSIHVHFAGFVFDRPGWLCRRRIDVGVHRHRHHPTSH